MADSNTYQDRSQVAQPRTRLAVDRDGCTRHQTGQHAAKSCHGCRCFTGQGADTRWVHVFCSDVVSGIGGTAQCFPVHLAWMHSADNHASVAIILNYISFVVFCTARASPHALHIVGCIETVAQSRHNRPWDAPAGLTVFFYCCAKGVLFLRLYWRCGKHLGTHEERAAHQGSTNVPRSETSGAV